MVSIKQFNIKNKETLFELLVEMQDHLIEVDPLKKFRRLPGFEKKFVKNLLTEMKGNKGTIFVASEKKIPIGFISGIVQEPDENRLLEYVPTRSGRVIDLIVTEKHRRKNIGTLLMRKMEKYFQKQKCDVIRVEVFKTNTYAHNFYKKNGYDDRNIDMIKNINHSE